MQTAIYIFAALLAFVASFCAYVVIGPAWFAGIAVACALIAAVEVAFHKLVGEALS